MIALQEIAIRLACRGGLCCSASDHNGMRVVGVIPTPGGSDDDKALRVRYHPVDVPALTLRLAKGATWQ